MNTFTVLVISVCCSVSVAQIFLPSTYALFDICDQTISISEDMILLLTINDTSKPPYCCRTSIESDVFKNRLLIQIIDFDLPASPRCNQTSLQLSGTDVANESGMLCGNNITTPVFNTTGRTVQVEYRSSGQEEEASNASFCLLISSFHTGPCDSYDFVCSNSLCIDGDMACNGYNDCSDDSDETIGCLNPSGGSKHILEIVTLSVVGGIFLVTVTVVCYVKIRRARAKGGKYLPIE